MIHHEPMLDGNARRTLATFVTTTAPRGRSVAAFTPSDVLHNGISMLCRWQGLQAR